MVRVIAVLFALVGASACSHPPILPDHSMAALRRGAATPATYGTQIYSGTVSRRGATNPALYVYERRVSVVDRGLQSSHLTRSPSGEPIVLQQAVHSSSYEVFGVEEVHSQSGLEGWVDVALDGTATFRTVVDGRTRTRIEPPGDPLQVGPTLFGYVLSNWESLAGGEALPIRFVAMNQCRSYRFSLRMADGPEGTTVVEMSPISPIIALGVPNIRMVFGRDKTLLRYEGLVPPNEVDGARLRRLNATVVYEHRSAEYR